MISNKYLKRNNIELNDKLGINEISVNNGIVSNSGSNIFEKKDYEDCRNRPLAAAVLGLNNTDIPLPGQLDYYTGWTDSDAQESYLQSKPKTYMILGKHGTGSYHLGEALSKKINCLHLCPKNVLLDEIEQKSPVGKCLDFNMRYNKVIRGDIILSLMKEKLESPSIKHRGFIISGLPLVTSSKNKQYLIENLYAEESLSVADYLLCELIDNLKKKKPRAKRSSVHSSKSSVDKEEGEMETEEEQEADQEAEEMEETIVELPKFVLDFCSDHIFSFKPYYTTKEILLLHQIQELFRFIPDIFILTSSPNLDTVVKRSRKFINYTNNSISFLPFPTNYDTEIRWPTHYSMKDYIKTIDNHAFNPKYYCKQPINFKKNAMAQICNYKDIVAPVIEQTLKDFDPNTLIKVDGRTTTHQMLNGLMKRFLLMPIKPVLIPEPLYMDEPPEELEVFWKTVEELNIIRSGVISFNRYASLWYNRCPVELFKRRSTQGKAKFAVIFFKHVYLLSTLNAMVSFCRNPRPYLQLKYLEPTCRMVILGTKSSGKTMIANCLSWLFTAPIICFTSLLKTEKQKKYDQYSKTILSEIIATIEDIRFTKWQSMEMQRKSDLSTWYNTVSSALSTYVPFLITVSKDEEFSEENFTGLKRFDALRDQLSFLPIDDLLECETILKDKNALLNYAPHDLLEETTKPTIPNLGDEDVTRAIASYIEVNDLQHDIEPTIEEIMKEIIQIIKNIDNVSSKTPEKTYGKFIIDGFPSDHEYWGHLVDSDLLPDYTIGLIENREIDADLIHHYTTIENCTKNHQERFLLSNDVLIKTKLLHGKPANNTYLDILIIVDHIIRDIFKFTSDFEDDENGKVTDTNAITSFTVAIDKFREEWDILKLKLEEHFKCFVELEIENKNDIEVLDNVLLKIRKCYFKPCMNLEDSLGDQDDDDDGITKDALTYNDSRFLGETNIYCPLAFYDHGVLWKGKSELATSYDNKLYCFSKEECSDIFQHDITKYVSYNKPYKKNIPLRICVVGSIGSEKTYCSKLIAKELGLLHVDFEDFINNTFIPKHFKKVGWQYENSFTDAPVDEEEMVEFQLDEENLNYISDIMFNEQELRRIFYNYFEGGSPLYSVLLQSLIKKLWNEKPFNDKGIVIEGFPKLPTDIEDMISCYCIPDIVIEIESSLETSLDRVSPKIFKKWKVQLNEAKLKAKHKLDLEKIEWLKLVTRTVVIKLIIDEIIENSFFLETGEEPFQAPSVQSTIFDTHPSGSTNVDANLFATYNEFIKKHPEPTDQNVWDKADDVLEKINNRLESIFEVEDENIQSLKDILNEQKIKTVSIDGKKKLNKITRQLLMALSDLRNKTSSFLEQTFVVSCDIAEMLLLEGFFLISKFYRMCPVYISEHPETKLNPYNSNIRKNNVFPIIHRPYIYFVSSEESVRKFRRDPLKYINNDQIKLYKEFPLRIGVIGPPKSGKSKLAAKLAKRYGLISISKGMAIRHVLENMNWTALGSTMISLLKEGKCIDNDLIMKAILTVALDHRTMTNGFILDGFPETPFEICELLKYGLYPLIMFDIASNQETTVKNSQNEVFYNILKVKPPLSRPFIKNRHDKWFEKCSVVRNWINSDTQNLYTLNGNASQWSCVVEACSKIEEINKEIHYFLTHAKSNVVSTSIMCISNEMFQQRMSCYKNLCPICFQKNILRHSGYPADKKGVIQYNNQLYWICPEHLKFVLNSPENLLCPKTLDIPEIPAVITTINTSLVYENGVCIVTYAENLPSQKLVRGKSNYAVIYQKNIYLLCSSKCMTKFLSKPHIFYKIKIFKNMNIFPQLTLNKLPHLGYLEQTIGNILTDACCLVNVLRPKYPGLDTSISAILFIALYLKVHNSKTNESVLPIYLETYKIYEARCKLVTDIGLRLRSIDNPFASYPKCCDKLNRVNKFDSASRVPVPDERYDYLCEYHKPASKVPAFLNVVDIAGLVKGAAEGQGLGNAFLSHIKACDAIFNLCRAFDDESVIHVDGEVNPVRDLETIGEELRLKDEEQLIQHIEKLDRAVNRGGDKKLKPEFEALAKVKTILVEEKKHIRFGDWSAADIEVLNKYLFLTSKPALYLVNLSEKDYIRKKNKWLPKLKEWIDKNDPGAPLIPFSGALESKLLDMEPDERAKFLKEANITSALDKIIVQGYKALQLEYFFTAGADEVKAWTIQKGTKAPQAAGRIHTDFEKGFIMAEVMHYKDFKEEGSESACKSAGKYRQQGRNYVVDDGDIIFFKFNAGAGLKDAKKK